MRNLLIFEIVLNFLLEDYFTSCGFMICCKVGKVVRERGWRCLDCTVCEGCGKATDESRLLLCDDCDISYHIYCLDPPLEQVPQGNWKCKWCVRCWRCGQSHPADWKNNYTECAHCYSLSTQCHICQRDYSDADLICKCVACEKWSHVSCNLPQPMEHQLQAFNPAQFVCSQCQQESFNNQRRLIEQQQQQQQQQQVAANSSSNSLASQHISETLVFLEELAVLTSKRNGCILDEGIFLTELGSELIKKIKIKPIPGVRRNRNLQKSATNANNQSNEKYNQILRIFFFFNFFKIF